MQDLFAPVESEGIPAEDRGIRTLGVLGTPLLVTSYADLWRQSLEWRRAQHCRAVDLTNTHIVTMRRHEASFATLTGVMDNFVPDSMPLTWCLNLQGAGMKDRVYGPEFMRRSLLEPAGDETHYFLGASDVCLSLLIERMKQRNPKLKIAGARNGYFKQEDEPGILNEINRLSPDFIWLGLGTPKQQEWIRRHKPAVRRGVILPSGSLSMSTQAQRMTLRAGCSGRV